MAVALGSDVVSADNQPGGFSPGVAARCGLADGRRVFLKAVSTAQNPDSPAMHRREARITSQLPAGLPVPTLIATIDERDWIVLVFEEIDGHPPAQPWSLRDLGATFDALHQLADALTPCPVPGLDTFADRYTEAFRGYRTLAGGDPSVDVIDTWSRAHLDTLAALEADWSDASAGTSLLHADLRADNLLVRADGSVVVVDWPHACVGAAWIDLACMLPSVGLDGGPAPDTVERQLRPLRSAEPDAVDRVLVALAGYFTYQGVQPDPPGLPTLRAFQRAQGQVTREWLARRLGWR
jgi:aminoglycoside phosphotransferase (APT) family kinase protein